MTVARLLQQGGYHTGMIGKWHLGSDPQGFDRWEILPGQGDYVDPVLYTATSEKTYTGRYATDVITDLALEFLEKRPADKPFFLMMHHKAPHRPWKPNAAHGAQFAGDARSPSRRRCGTTTRAAPTRCTRTSSASPTTSRRTDLKQAPPAGLTGDALTRWKYQRYMQDYLAMRAVGGRQRRPRARLRSTRPAWAATRS